MAVKEEEYPDLASDRCPIVLAIFKLFRLESYEISPLFRPDQKKMNHFVLSFQIVVSFIVTVSIAFPFFSVVSKSMVVDLGSSILHPYEKCDLHSSTSHEHVLQGYQGKHG